MLEWVGVSSPGCECSVFVIPTSCKKGGLCVINALTDVSTFNNVLLVLSCPVLLCPWCWL